VDSRKKQGLDTRAIEKVISEVEENLKFVASGRGVHNHELAVKLYEALELKLQEIR
jgi:hypothetical protein